MKRLNIAMLGEQTQSQQVVVDQNNEALATDQDMSQIKQSGYEIDNDEAIVQEASDTVDALRNTTQRIEQMPATSPEVIQIAQEQIAYFEKRTGIKMSSVTTAMESYTPNRKQELVKQMRLATEKLNSNISIAQEGILDRIKNRFSLVHNSVEKLKKELDTISITDGSLKTEEIKDPAFARVLNHDGKQKLSTTDVLSFVKNTVEISDKSATVKVLRDLTSQLKEVIILMKRQNTTYDEDEQEVQKSTEIINYSYDSAKEVLEELEYKYAKNSSDVEPLNYNDAISLKTLTLSLLDNKEIQNAEETFKTTFDEFEKITESHFKKGGKGLLQDTYLAKHNLSKLAPKAYSVIEKITAVRFEVAHACVKYIKASTASI